MLNLVTGGNGFIGTHLCQLLLKQGESVRILDIKQPVEQLPGVDYIKGDITDLNLVRRAVAGCDRVYHLAALSGLWGPDKNAFITVNQLGTRNVLDAAADAGVKRVIHTSTESILIAMGRGRRPQHIDEQTQCHLEQMAGAYCRGKYLAEEEARLSAARGNDVIIVNPTIPCGPGDHWITPPTRMMLGFLNRRLPAFLDSTLNLVDARDVALGHYQAARSGVSGQRYILGAHNIRLQELLRQLETLTQIKMPKRQVPYGVAYLVGFVNEFISDYITRRPPAAPLAGVRIAGIPVTFENRLTREQLNWTPRPLVDSLRDAINDYQQRGLMPPSV
ncbi:MAG: NAD-dependent epimerase/dehydratase family protein [Wenzhouxiangellaceae bacterium]